jgi:hypothetical protein
MQEAKHIAALNEVNEYIDESLKDPNGLLGRQRLLMTSLSLGMQHVVELWLHKSHAIKPGAIVKHDFFSSGERNLKIKLTGMLTKNIDSLQNSNTILAIAREIEQNRNDIIYGAPLESDKALREKLDHFFELKKAVKDVVGDEI